MQKQYLVHGFTLVTLLALAAPLKADVFIFNLTTVPMTGSYIPVGTGAFTFPDNSEAFDPFGPLTPFGPNIAYGEFFISKNAIVPIEPGSLYPCTLVTLPAGCRNIAESAQVADGGPSYSAVGIGAGPYVGIYDSEGDPIAEIRVACGPDSVCDVDMITGTGGGPLPLSSLPFSWQAAFSTGPSIIANTSGFPQDAVDVTFYDGTVASFGFIAPVPEPWSVALLVTLIAIFISAGLRRRHYHSRAD